MAEFLLCILLVIPVLLVIFLISEVSQQFKSLRYETFSAKARVCKKKYEDSYTTISMVGTVPVPQHHDEEYNVYLMYKGKVHCLNDKDLYQKVDVGDVVSVLVHKGYNKNGELKHVYLRLKKWSMLSLQKFCDGNISLFFLPLYFL